MSEYLLEVKDLQVHFPVGRGLGRNKKVLKAVDGVSFSLKEGETLGIVGESGCGKSTCGNSIIRLLNPTAGQIIFQGQDLAKMNQRQLRGLRRDIQMIFQDPFSSLNPRMRVKNIIAEPLITHNVCSGTKLEAEVGRLMDAVGLPREYADRYPHEFSGGQRQRINVARALALKPKIIVCDEPVSALDVSIQAQVLNLFNRLQRQHNLTYIFISHDLGVIKHVSDRIAIMYLGRVVELCRAAQIYENPLHPYTKALLSAIPPESPFQKKERIVLKGEIPSPIGDQVGCPLAGRCPNCTERCTREIPTLQDIGDGHQVACFLYH